MRFKESALYPMLQHERNRVTLEANLSICLCDRQAHVLCTTHDESWPLLIQTESLDGVKWLESHSDVVSA